MAKLMSKKTKEIVQTVAVLVLIAMFVTFYIVYPLLTVPGMTARSDRDRFDDPTFAPENDPSFFVNIGLHPDTFAVITEDNIRLAGLYFRPDSSRHKRIRGTIILLADSDTGRTAFSSYIVPLLDSGLAVAIYDQRATGLSGGQYRAAGVYEADDLIEVIAYLKLHGKLLPPLIAAGFGLGADAVINASAKEIKIDQILAIDPNLTANRWIDKTKEKNGSWSIPLYRMVYFWWYRKLSGHALERTGTDKIAAVTGKTILMMNQDDLNGKEVARFETISGDKVSISARPVDQQELRTFILNSTYAATK